VYLRQCDECYPTVKEHIEVVVSKAGDFMDAVEKKRKEGHGGEIYKKIGSKTSSIGSVVQSATRAVADTMAKVSKIGEWVVLHTVGACGSAIECVGDYASNAGEHYIEIQEKFTEIYDEFRELQEKANALNVEMVKLTVLVKIILCNSNIVTTGETDIDTLKNAFHILLESIRQAREKIDPHASKNNDVRVETQLAGVVTSFKFVIAIIILAVLCVWFCV
jgi:hypothetical protein